MQTGQRFLVDDAGVVLENDLDGGAPGGRQVLPQPAEPS